MRHPPKLALVAALAALHAGVAGAATWTPAASMQVARAVHTATLLPSGEVLVAGGLSRVNALGSVELYDPVADLWTAASRMVTPRIGQTATLLPSGRVLVTGGSNGNFIGAVALRSAELYDPATGTWVPAADMATARVGQTATLLGDGRVLVAGGVNGVNDGPNEGDDYLKSAELYDPANDSWSQAADMAVARQDATATLLRSGQVLVAGGYNGDSPLNSAELYDPATNTWRTTPAMAAGRDGDSATLLPDGEVLVAGGFGPGGGPNLRSAELYDPATGAWRPAASMAAPRAGQTATLLPGGDVLVAGGIHAGVGLLRSAELYHPTRDTWSAAPSMAAARTNDRATLLTGGRVLVSGGDGDSGPRRSAELYSPPGAPSLGPLSWRGGQLSYTDSQAARTTLTILRRLGRTGVVCAEGTPGVAAQSCALLEIARFTHSDRHGLNRDRLRLPAGSYVLRAEPARAGRIGLVRGLSIRV